MKIFKSITMIAILAMVLVVVGPANAQLGTTDVSSFTIQNIDSVTATVTVRFYAENGTMYTPTVLNSAKPNPFTLVPNESFQVYMPGISDASLPDGRYSVVIESTARVVAIANMLGQGSVYFNGSYTSFDMGAPTFYLPGVVYDYYDWYSLISVQNVGTVAANVTINFYCKSGATGSLTYNGIPVNSSHHFDLETQTPNGFTAGVTSCNGSAVITSNTNIVVVDNQSVSLDGRTQSYSGVASGTPKVFIPALYTGYYGWAGSLNIQKLGTGNTTVTVTYSDGYTPSTCALTDAAPSCFFYMPNVHPTTGYYAATITNSANLDLMVIANAAKNITNQAQTYNGIGMGTDSVGIPAVYKYYYNWISSFTCQNVGTTATDLYILFEDYPTYPQTISNLGVNQTIQIQVKYLDFIASGYIGAVDITGNDGAQIACIVNMTNDASIATQPGDWSMSYNAFNK